MPRRHRPASISLSCRKVESEKAAFLSDWHIPYHDQHTLEIALRFLAWFKPHTVFIVGDFLDFYSISKFSKDPKRILALQEDLNTGKEVLRRLRKACLRARIVYLDGNHEQRLIRYLWEHPEISVLDSLRLPELLSLEDIDAEHYSYHQPQRWYGLQVEHGDRVNKHSGATAKAMLEVRGVSGVSGHTHRAGTHFRTDESGMKAWWELGCLCGLEPEYIISKPNWQQCVTLGFGSSGKKRFIIEQAPVIDHALFYAGREWRA